MIGVVWTKGEPPAFTVPPDVRAQMLAWHPLESEGMRIALRWTLALGKRRDPRAPVPYLEGEMRAVIARHVFRPNGS